ncbi:helix-turn-helix domain-containing protein [Xanthocytophaga flava]|uniref:helix-turn-helix domain-containing protein n=1 Tax=Xanthocytophaga flava TaxID=3048013 RepID=UPI0028D3DF3A|nr:helix-turn-helix domain-containing protein [Xanthocytophaga flavus]MDJ1473364.1 helix-turn-helix domain-containing protein [Xanthocytophaga flavus]
MYWSFRAQYYTVTIVYFFYLFHIVLSAGFWSIISDRFSPLTQTYMHTSYKEVISCLSRIEILLSDIRPNLSQVSDLLQDNERLGGIELAMEITGLAKSTIYHLAADGLIPFMKQRRKLYFSSRDLYQWIKDGKHKTLQEMEEEIERHLSQTHQSQTSGLIVTSNR